MKGLRLFVVVVLALVIGACDVNPAEQLSSGNDLFSRQDYPGALRAYQLAQAASPDISEPYFNAASAFARSGQFEKAVEALQMVLSLHSSQLQEAAYYNLGNVYFMMDRFEDAIAAYQQTLLLDSGDQDARYNLELALRRVPSPSLTPPPIGAEPTSTSVPSSPASAPTLEPPATIPEPAAGTLTVQQAEQLLDIIQRDQQTLRDRTQLTPQSSPPEKDW